MYQIIDKFRIKFLLAASQVLCAAIFIFTALPSAAVTEQVNDNQTTNNEMAVEKFDYILENREDPFVPFISEKAAATKSIDMSEIMDNNSPLSGMQLFEPGQLTLVALMQRGNQDIAMVEDFTGKGYILTEGIKIGRRGIVKDIATNNVIIEETAVTRAGKKIITEIVMILKKEGEE